MTNALWPHRLQPVRLLCPWNSPGKNSEVGSHSLLPGIFPTQGSNLGLPQGRQILYRLSQQGSPLSIRCSLSQSRLSCGLDWDHGMWSSHTISMWWYTPEECTQALFMAKQYWNISTQTTPASWLNGQAGRHSGQASVQTVPPDPTPQTQSMSYCPPKWRREGPRFALLCVSAHLPDAHRAFRGTHPKLPLMSKAACGAPAGPSTWLTHGMYHMEQKLPVYLCSPTRLFKFLKNGNEAILVFWTQFLWPWQKHTSSSKKNFFSVESGKRARNRERQEMIYFQKMFHSSSIVTGHLFHDRPCVRGKS